MKRTNQHPTSNIQRPGSLGASASIENWTLNVECSVLLLLSSLPLCAQTSTNDLPTLAPPYGELPPTFWEQHGTMILISGTALVILAGVATGKLLQPKAPVILPPDVQARTALANLLNRPEDGKLLSDVSQILRRYFIAAFDLPDGEPTTAEFCHALAGTEKINLDLGEIVSRFLRECDERKFSPAGSDVSINAAARALELISLAENSRRPQPAQT